MDLPFSPTSAGTARRALAGWLHELGYDNGIVDDAQLVITELIANSVRHASPLSGDRLNVGWRREGARLLLTVRDGGGTTVPEQVSAGPESLSGRGLQIVDALGSSWSVESNGNGSVISVQLDLP